MFRQTKIGATVGPACQTVEILTSMVKAGMNYARLNFSHGTHENHEVLIHNLRAVEELTKEPLIIMQDLRGPKMRLGILPAEGVKVDAGQMIVLNTARMEYAEGEVAVDCPGLERLLKAGERILMDDGKVEVKISRLTGSKIYAEVIEGGLLQAHKGLNFPDSQLSISPLSEKDKTDLRFGVKMGVDMVAMSFVHSAQDIIDLRFLIKQYEDELGLKSEHPIQIIAKIERHEAVAHIKEILDAADGVMIARGDLGLEISAAEVPLIQKQIISQANALAKPVIVATQMLDSMQHNRRPTRAEVSDVANAVIDHADALLLANETAAGEYPVIAVETMADIIITTEKSVFDDTALPSVHKNGTSVDQAVVELSRILAEEVKAKVVMAASLSGETGRLISHVRPALPIMVATNNERVWRQLNLSWGVKPFILPPCRSIEELVARSMDYLKQHKIAKTGDKMIVVAGEPVGQAGQVNLVEIREIL